ncbi:Sat6 [Stachybotrys chartarum IBT 7711]|uniref:Probable trichothecene esterase SAT6 n=1 Tax=Stachybotrys chartarum (strain CBS 109288 / IBT 7711) TaxID=1280523 RepID=SAT6_STACB|nr:RecName: Full=Probable trichothecene esterase SAT6; AltName: Full=Satratoxin biosynthesis SC1 cluster protein 6 [Stachybotrys chartarum IBT 7711]KEY74373.1 Sat6 [Stachybotrys chartarum IBT 7711]KFA55643.1 Sat6 [Stachybotrys chartarum IBT 40293]
MPQDPNTTLQMSSSKPSLSDLSVSADPVLGKADNQVRDSLALPSIEGGEEGVMRPLAWLFGLCAIQQASGATLLRNDVSTVEPLPPTQDPWYRAPPGFEKKQPGDVLRIRQAPGNLTTVVSNSSAAFHILFRTTNARSEPAWAVTTLFLPKKLYRAPSRNAALLSFQLADNSANPDSAPSLGLYWRLAQDNPMLGLRSDTSFISNLLSEGWLVNIPDQSGPEAAFGASRQAGHATIDAIRAIQHLCSLTGATGINAAIWGYSGGTFATGAAAELMPTYAPNINIVGAVLGGMVTDVSGGFDSLNRSPIAATIIATLLGVTAQFPEERAYLESRLVPETRDEFMSVLDINVFDALVHFAGRDIYAFFIDGAADIEAPILQNLFEAQSRIGFGDIPPMPMFIYKAIADEVVPIGPTDVTVQRWCDGGADITYERNTVGGHIAEIENGKPRAIQWLWSIFDESYSAQSPECRIRDVTVEVPVQVVGRV